MRFWKKLSCEFLILVVALYPLAPIVVAEEATTSAKVTTGDIVAVAESVTEVNTVNVGSELTIQTQTVTDPSHDVVATQSAVLASEVVATQSAQQMTIKNQVEATTSAEAVANSGNNVQKVNEDAEMQTGNAVAVAAATTVANATLVKSELAINNIVVTNPWEGNLIVAPMRDSDGGTWQIQLDNTGNVTTLALANVTTGNNVQIGGAEAEMVTGDGAAIAQATTIANASLFNSDFFGFLMNNIWLWSGNIRNFAAPGSIEIGREIWEGIGTEADCGESCPTSIEVRNEVDITTVASASANTGGNTQIAEDAKMLTGDGAAVAIATTVANATLVNSRMRIYQMMLLSPWTGDLIFAYPDLSPVVIGPKEIDEGSLANYQVKVVNRGYDYATSVRVKEKILIDGEMVGTKTIELEELAPGQVWETQIEQGTLGLSGKTMTIQIVVETDSTEESTNNNQAQAVTKVISKPKTTDQKDDEGEYAIPILRLSGGNNVGEYVYPGDGVTYDFVASNEGPITIKDVTLVQTLISPNDGVIKQATGAVGEIALNKNRTIRFVLSMGSSMVSGIYKTETYLTGHTDQGVEIRSNTIINQIPLRNNILGQAINKVEAAETTDLLSQNMSNGIILGASSVNERNCSECHSIPWYVGVTAGVMAYYLVTQRRRDFARVIRFGLTLPLAGYAGLLASQLDCRNGLMLVEGADFWCRYFLPVAYLIYGSFTMVVLLGRNYWIKSR